MLQGRAEEGSALPGPSRQDFPIVSSPEVMDLRREPPGVQTPETTAPPNVRSTYSFTAGSA